MLIQNYLGAQCLLYSFIAHWLEDHINKKYTIRNTSTVHGKFVLDCVAQREIKEVDISQWGKKIYHLRFKNAFYNSFESESKFIESENKNSLRQIVWLLEVGEGMQISHFTF